IRALVRNPRTILQPDTPAETKANGTRPIDMAEKVGQYPKSLGVAGHPTTVPAWHGTILPKSDADLWLASSFAEFERLVAMENAYRAENNGGDLNNHQKLRMALERNRFRTECSATLGGDGGFSLAAIKPATDSADWYHRATGRGVLVLHELRGLLTPTVFDKAMEEFGTNNAGKAVPTGEFRELMEKAGKRKLNEFFDAWVTGKEWIEFELADVEVKHTKKHQVTGIVRRKGPACEIVNVTVETGADEVSINAKFEGDVAKFDISTEQPPLRVVVDKYLSHARVGPTFSLQSLWSELPQTLIVYGTADDHFANRDAAQQMQRLIRSSSANHTVPIKADRDVKNEDLKDRHLILIGRPDSNALVQRFADLLPVRFGPRSVRVGPDLLANARSAVIAAAANPLGMRHVLIVVAGLSAEATRDTAMKFTEHTHQAADVVVLPHGAGATPLLMPTAKLVRELR
ncbi:MAG TPA: M1 family aminopeptidase, partial [Vicinamibacterales bacterium]|nr:M1 family aminopeptidase [Vicinamibacterales bacterium]